MRLTKHHRDVIEKAWDEYESLEVLAMGDSEID